MKTPFPPDPKGSQENGKPVIYRDARSILTSSPEFRNKKLCDGLVVNLGDACHGSCAFCYVGCAMYKVLKPILVEHFAANDK